MRETSPEKLGVAFLVVVVRQGLSLDFRNGDGLLIADFHAALTAQTFLSIDRHRFPVLNLINVYRANLHTLLAPFALFMIHGYFISHRLIPPILKCNSKVLCSSRDNLSTPFRANVCDL
jgi:hypothetical protein